jgi:hypothetical protein
VKTVDILPNLPSELDIVVLRSSSQVKGDLRLQHHHVLEVTAHAIWSHCYEQSRDD